MKTIKIILLVSTGVFLMSCSRSAPTVNYANVCDPANKDKEVTVEGYIASGKPVPCQWLLEASRRCGFKFLSKPDDAGDKGFIVYFAEGKGNNQIETTETGTQTKKTTVFKQDEVKIKSGNGSLVSPQDKIKVMGKVSLTTGSVSNETICSVAVDRIEK